MTVHTQKISVTTVGANGSAAGSAKSERPLRGELLAVYHDYTGEPNTTDVTIATVNAPVKTLLVITDSATDGWYYPRYIPHGPTGSALTATAGGDNVCHPIDDYVSVTVAQGDSAKTVDVWIVTRGQ